MKLLDRIITPHIRIRALLRRTVARGERMWIFAAAEYTFGIVGPLDYAFAVDETIDNLALGC